MKFKRYFKKIHKFLTEDIWIIEAHRLSRLKKFIFKQTRIFYIIVKDFFDDKCQMRSAALSFRTLLSLVPFFALIFSVAKSFGLQRNLGAVLLEKLALGQEDVINNILAYIENTNVNALGYIGFFFLMWIVIGMFSMIEETFNDIWGIKQGRSIVKKIAGYLSVLIVIPVLFIIITTFNTILATNMPDAAIMSGGVLRFFLGNVRLVLPYALTCLVFIGIYKFMPNTKVNFSSAFWGGIIAGIVWQFLQWSYINFQVGVSRYNVIYGAFATFPIFLIWIYVSWMILLLGAEISFACQNEKNYVEARVSANTAFEIKRRLALNLMYTIALNCGDKKRLQTAEGLADVLEVPVRLVREILFILNKQGLLAEVPSENKTFLYEPARPVEDIRIADVLHALDRYGTQYVKIKEELPGKELSAILEKKESSFLHSDLNRNFRELLEKK